MDLEEGMRIACKINNHIIDDSSIQEHEGNLYICQDKADGYDCPDKLGYKYSWRIDKGNNIDLLDAGVEQVVIIDEIERTLFDDEIRDSFSDDPLMKDYDGIKLKNRALSKTGKLEKGMMVRCHINGNRVGCGIIQEEYGSLYICQNIISGNPCQDKLGFHYSWCIEEGDSASLESNHVSELEIIGKENENIFRVL